MPENPFINESTEDIITMMGDGNVIGITEMIQELSYRVIKENDVDDSPQHRGGVRPTRQPINP